MKRSGILVISLRFVNQGLWSHLKRSGWKATIFRCQSIFWGALQELHYGSYIMAVPPPGIWVCIMLLTFEKQYFWIFPADFLHHLPFSCISMHLSCFLGNRYITTTESMWAPEMAKILEEEFKPLGKIILVGVKIWLLCQVVTQMHPTSSNAAARNTE